MIKLTPTLAAATLACLLTAQSGFGQCLLQTIEVPQAGPSGNFVIDGPFFAMETLSSLGDDTVSIFEEVDGVWLFRNQVQPGIAQGFGPGSDFALEGTRLVVGGPGPNEAFLYEYNGVDWLETAVLQPPMPTTLFGVRVDLQGGSILISAPYSENATGSIFEYELQNGSWVHTETIKAPTPEVDALFGSSMARDGDTLLVRDGFFSARLHVFVEEQGSWQAKQVIPAPGPPTGLDFGRELVLRGDLAIAASGLAGQFTEGVAFTLERIAGSWSITGSLAQPSPTAFDQFGAGVAISEAGLVAVTAPGSSAAGPNAGATFLFERSGPSWSIAQTISSAQSPGNGNVAWSGPRLFGATLIPGKTIEVLDPLGATTFCVGKVNSQGCVPQLASSGQPSISDATPFSITASNVISNSNGLFFYGLNGPAGIPFQGGSLCAQPPLRRTSVSNSGGNAVLDCSGSYAFDLNAWVQGGNDPNLVVGARVVGQFWSRDVDHPDATGAGLTPAIDLLLCQ